MWGLPQKQNASRADKIRLCGHLRRYKKIVKKTYIISELKLLNYDARKLKKLPGVFLCRILWNFLHKRRNRGPPFIRERFWWKVIEKLEKNFSKKFSAFSIFYRFLFCPRCEREDQASFTTALSRGEVIPFEIEPSGERNRAEKILHLLHQSSAWRGTELSWWAESAERAGSDWIIRLPCPCCPDSGNRKSVFKETAIPVVETFIINS